MVLSSDSACNTHEQDYYWCRAHNEHFFLYGLSSHKFKYEQSKTLLDISYANVKHISNSGLQTILTSCTLLCIKEKLINHYVTITKQGNWSLTVIYFPLSTIILLDCGTVSTVWHFILFSMFLLLLNTWYPVCYSEYRIMY